MAATSTLILTAVGTAMSVASSISQGQQQAAYAESQQKMANMQGELAELSSRQEAADIQQEALRTRSKQVAQASAAGVTLDSGSFLDIVSSSATEAKNERQDVLRLGRLNKAAAQAQASQYGIAASRASSSGWINAGTSLLQGASQGLSVADKAGWLNSSTTSQSPAKKSITTGSQMFQSATKDWFD